ncbi:20S-pre-rRNA D-site endonuclease nob1 [Exophiala dermatitidis]
MAEPTGQNQTPSGSSETTKPVHTIILDSSPLLLNTPSISTLLANGHVLVTTPSVLAEIRAPEARQRIDTLYKPFLTVRTPKPESVKRIKEFARKTGDGAVLSQTDFEILALAYDIECERNGGDWRLRSNPGQKRVNGRPPVKDSEAGVEGEGEGEGQVAQQEGSTEGVGGSVAEDEDALERSVEALKIVDEDATGQDNTEVTQSLEGQEEQPEADGPTTLELSEGQNGSSEQPSEQTAQVAAEAEPSDSEEGWITPSNIKKRQAKDEAADSKARSESKHLQVATMTGDFAMQNVLLQMNLNLLSTKTCQRISQIKQFILRCHGCFATTKDMTKQFCPRCGKPTLTRVSCTTNDKGETKLHLKANMQWNNRGNVFPIPKPTSGSANQKWKGPRQGGGQGGWGNDLILAEDQKEYIRAMSTMKRTKEKDLMDEDTLPNILSGRRSQTSGGRPKVGAGRNINSRKR